VNISKEDVAIANKLLKQSLLSPTIKELGIETTGSYQFTFNRLDKLKKGRQ
jgi:hypothetical protein